MRRKYTNLLIIVIAISIIFISNYKYNIRNINHYVFNIFNKIQPCTRPITYSLGSVDANFKISDSELNKSLDKATGIWESAINKNLFASSTDGHIKINLIYDYRQEASDEMKKIGINIDNRQSVYNKLKEKRNSLITSFNSEKKIADDMVLIYEKDRNIYTSISRQWNNKEVKQTEAAFLSIEKKRIEINNQVTEINKARDILNGLTNTLNSTGAILNNLVKEVNSQVKNYNAIGSSTGKIFDEGEYVLESGEESINIYQFKDINQLTRVLTHEFGHALDLDHLNNSKAVMYYLNEDGNDDLTDDDINALKTACKI